MASYAFVALFVLFFAVGVINLAAGRYLFPISLTLVNIELPTLKTKKMALIDYLKGAGIGSLLIISIFGIAMIFQSLKKIFQVIAKNNKSEKGVNYILMHGSLAFIMGILSQALGMMEAFMAIQHAGDISPGLIAAGLRVSMIAPLYGLFYFIISIPVWFVLHEKTKAGNV